MCGITGLIGSPKNDRAQKLSYQLAKTLLATTVERGPHATGVYSFYPKEDGGPKLFCYKLAAPAPDYVKTKYWKQMKDKWPFLLLGHCRFYTHGSPDDHLNNHPHLSDDNRMALVHNGVIGGFAGLNKTYPCKSECDSEVILRIIESEDDIVEGIKKVYRIMGTGDSFACLLSKWDPEEKIAHLWAFKNNGRPICYIDLIEEWGQIHFASTPEIMEKALKKSGLPKAIQDTKCIEIPDDQIWYIRSDTLEFECIDIEKPVVVDDYRSEYTNPNRNFQRVGSSQTERDPEKNRVKALIDAIVENCTEIDDNVRLGAVSGYGGYKELEEKLKTVAFELEKLVNPAIDDDEDDSVADNEYYD